MAELLEDGDIYFLYRPRIAEEHVDSLEEVQRLLVVMHPWQGRHLRALRVCERLEVGMVCRSRGQRARTAEFHQRSLLKSWARGSRITINGEDHWRKWRNAAWNLRTALGGG